MDVLRAAYDRVKYLPGAGLAHLCQGLFFVSSRRRHTRSTRDWSSDVCSSDLVRLDVADGVAAGQGVAVLGQRVQCEAEVGQGAVELVLLQEGAEVGAVAAGAHVVAAGAGGHGWAAGGDGAGVHAPARVAVGVERGLGVGVAAGQRLGVGGRGVASAVGAVAVAGGDVAGVVQQLRHRAVHVGAVGVGAAGPAAGGIGQAQAMAEGVVGVGLGLGVAAAGLLLLGDQAGQALEGEAGGAVLGGAGVVLDLFGGAVQRVVGVAGGVGARPGGVVAGPGQPVEVVVGVVDHQVR